MLRLSAKRQTNVERMEEEAARNEGYLRLADVFIPLPLVVSTDCYKMQASLGITSGKGIKTNTVRKNGWHVRARLGSLSSWMWGECSSP